MRNTRKIRNYLIVGLIGFSAIWTIFDWTRYGSLEHHLGEVAYVAGLLAATEALFIVGALLMAVGVGLEVSEHRGLRGFFSRIYHVRKHTKAIAKNIATNAIFTIGFWLNFAGAVGTSLILIAGVIGTVPVAGWGLLVILIIDLIATFGWRIPLHQARKAHMSKSKIIVRQATLTDIEDYLKLQAERWNEDNMAHRDQLESRLKAYPQGMLVAERAGEIVGMTYAMRITDYDFENPPSWDEITHNGYCDSADPHGKYIFGVDLSTSKTAGRLAGDQLLLQIGRIAIAENVKIALLGGRMPGYHEHAATMSAEEYLWAKRSDGKPLDRQVRYYTGIPGLKAIKSIPNYFNDPDSLDYGVLLKWQNPFYGLPGRRFWASLFPIAFKLEELYIRLTK